MGIGLDARRAALGLGRLFGLFLGGLLLGGRLFTRPRLGRFFFGSFLRDAHRLDFGQSDLDPIDRLERAPINPEKQKNR